MNDEPIASGLTTPVQQLISVTVRDRSREAPWGSGPTRPVIRTIQISAFCPRCGARRGEPRSLHTYDDGEHYWVDTWTCSNACGHVDHYTNVVVEAERIAAATAEGSTAAADARTR